MLFFVPFGVQGDQVNVHVRLRNALHAQVQVTADLIGGFHISFHADASNAQFLPAQIIGGDIRKELWRVDRTAHFH